MGTTTKRARDEDSEATQPIAGPSRTMRQPVKAAFDEEELSGDESDDLVDDGSDEMDEDDASEATDSDEEDDDEDDIRQAVANAQARPKKKRKRALPHSAFGALLSSLIAAPVPTRQLRPLHPPPSSEALERKALKLLQANRHEREERGHVSDVIAGWTPRPNIPFSQWTRLDEGQAAKVEYGIGGAEKEKDLRRLAQKGTVRLFNAIKAAQTTVNDGEAPTNLGNRAATIREETARRAVKSASPAVSVSTSSSTPLPKEPLPAVGSAHSRQANALGGRGKQEALANLSKASFLELFKTGSNGRSNLAV